MTIQSYRMSDYSFLASSPEEVRKVVSAMFVLFGSVRVQIGVHQAFDGCATPFECRTDQADRLTDDILKPICSDYPLQTALVTPLFA